MYVGFYFYAEPSQPHACLSAHCMYKPIAPKELADVVLAIRTNGFNTSLNGRPMDLWTTRKSAPRLRDTGIKHASSDVISIGLIRRGCPVTIHPVQKAARQDKPIFRPIWPVVALLTTRYVYSLPVEDPYSNTAPNVGIHQQSTRVNRRRLFPLPPGPSLGWSGRTKTLFPQRTKEAALAKSHRAGAVRRPSLWYFYCQELGGGYHGKILETMDQHPDDLQRDGLGPRFMLPGETSSGVSFRLEGQQRRRGLSGRIHQGPSPSFIYTPVSNH